MAASTPQGKARFTPSRLAALTVSQPRASSHQRSFFASVINREFAPRHSACRPAPADARGSLLLAPHPRTACFAAVSPAPLLSELSCDTAADQHAFRDEDGRGVFPFCPRYCPWTGSNHLLGVADEEGLLSLIDTSKPAGEQPRERGPGPALIDHAEAPAGNLAV